MRTAHTIDKMEKCIGVVSNGNFISISSNYLFSCTFATCVGINVNVFYFGTQFVTSVSEKVPHQHVLCRFVFYLGIAF